MIGSAALIKKLCSEYKLSRQTGFELVSHFCGVSKAQVLADTAVDEAQVLSAAKRAVAGEPLQYIIGKWSFMGREILCKKGVLIPREDTETLVARALSLYKGGAVCDICCGSGCVGIALADALKTQVTCVDISDDALALTAENAALWGVSVKTKKLDILKAGLGEKYSLITCNPPYIPTKTIRTLDKSVRAYEPHLALDGGRDGLSFYRRLAEIAEQSLVCGGAFACEIGFDQKDAVCAIFKAAGFAPSCIQDSFGQDRVVFFEKF